MRYQYHNESAASRSPVVLKLFVVCLPSSIRVKAENTDCKDYRSRISLPSPAVVVLVEGDREIGFLDFRIVPASFSLRFV